MNNYMCIHTFTSEEARREYLTPPEKRDPPEKRLTEKRVGKFRQLNKSHVPPRMVGRRGVFFLPLVRGKPRRYS